MMQNHFARTFYCIKAAVHLSLVYFWEAINIFAVSDWQRKSKSCHVQSQICVWFCQFSNQQNRTSSIPYLTGYFKPNSTFHRKCNFRIPESLHRLPIRLHTNFSKPCINNNCVNFTNPGPQKLQNRQTCLVNTSCETRTDRFLMDFGAVSLEGMTNFHHSISVAENFSRNPNGFFPVEQ